MEQAKPIYAAGHPRMAGRQAGDPKGEQVFWQGRGNSRRAGESKIPVKL